MSDAAISKAEAFRALNPEEAMKRHPDLINAYAVVRASEIVAERELAFESDRQKYRSMVVETVAQRIEADRPLPQAVHQSRTSAATVERER